MQYPFVLVVFNARDAMITFSLICMIAILSHTEKLWHNVDIYCIRSVHPSCWYDKLYFHYQHLLTFNHITATPKQIQWLCFPQTQWYKLCSTTSVKCQELTMFICQTLYDSMPSYTWQHVNTKLWPESRFLLPYFFA